VLGKAPLRTGPALSEEKATRSPAAELQFFAAVAPIG